MAKPILYSYWRSSCSWRVRIALNLKQIAYDIKPIQLVKNGGENNTAEYQKINPMGKIPALHIDGHTLIESLNIMSYLEETRPEIPILPSKPLERARVREICEVICSGIQPLQNVAVLVHLGGIAENVEWAQHWIKRGFAGLEVLLKESAGRYCVGDGITMADCCLVPQVYNARRYKVNIDDYPTIARIDKELTEHRAFKATHPDSQPDVNT